MIYIGLREDPPGHKEYWDRAKEVGMIHGGITAVTENGKYIHVDFQFNPEMFRYADDTQVAGGLKFMLESAVKSFSKHVGKLREGEVTMAKKTKKKGKKSRK